MKFKRSLSKNEFDKYVTEISNSNLENAISEILALIEEFPNNLNLSSTLVKLHKQNDDIHKAINAQKALIKKFGPTANNLTELAQLLKLVGDTASAEKYYRGAVKQESKSGVTNYNLGCMLKSNGKILEAETEFKRAIKKGYKTPQSYLNLANTNNALGSNDAALDNYSKALKLDPNYIQALINMSQVLVKIGQGEKAIVFAKKAVTSAINSNAAHDNYAQQLLILGQFERSVSAFCEAILLFDQDSKLYLGLAKAYIGLGDLTNALSSTNRSIELNNTEREAHYILGYVNLNLGNDRQAISNYKRAIELGHESSALYNELGNAYLQTERTTLAKQCYEKSLEISPNSIEALFNLGSLELKAYRIAKARILLTNCLRNNPKYVPALINLGLLNAKLNKYEEALDLYTRASTIDHESIEARVNLANLHHSIGNSLDAVKMYRKLLNQGHKQDSIIDSYNVILRETNSQQEALSICQQHVSHGAQKQSSDRKIIALITHGRAGSLFFHSLFETNKGISTLPGIYLKSWFAPEVHQRFQPDLGDKYWRENLIKKIVNDFEPLFDASCMKNVPGVPLGESTWLARDLGMTSLGEDRNKVGKIDHNAFAKHLLAKLSEEKQVTKLSLFEDIHDSLDLSTKKKSTESRQIFFHIHNPTGTELAGFLDCYPRAKIVKLVRSPIQNLESWFASLSLRSISNFKNLDEIDRLALMLRNWEKKVNRVIEYFSELNSPVNRLYDVRGVRLEDVKKNNGKDIMALLEKWWDIECHSDTFDSIAYGHRYWGPPSVSTSSISGFDDKALGHKDGREFGQRDILILKTLLWPFEKDFCYTSFSEEQFMQNLARIRPWLDEPFDFERNMYDEIGHEKIKLEKIGPYIRLHTFLKEWWKALKQNELYDSRLVPLHN